MVEGWEGGRGMGGWWRDGRVVEGWEGGGGMGGWWRDGSVVEKEVEKKRKQKKVIIKK